jgi:peroxiredoxin
VEKTRDFHALPADLPIPEDDGAADGLTGRALPPVTLEATTGGPVDLVAAAAAGTVVVYAYPRTGIPGQPLVPGWNEIPGARGCTPENCSFRDHAADFAELGARVFGLSAQAIGEQRDFAERERMPYPLLNDTDLTLAARLGLPTFDVAGVRLYRRLTFIARRGRIERVFYPVFPPDTHVDEVIGWLRGPRRARGRS